MNKTTKHLRPKIAAIQMNSGSDLTANLMLAARLIRDAAQKGAQMVVLPEAFALMPKHDSENLSIAEDQDNGQIQTLLSQCAIDNNVWIVAGTIPLKIENSTKVSCASLMYNDKGEVVARYNKIHLFDVDVANEDDSTQEKYRESDTYEAGKDIVVIDTPFGKIGMSVCYDLRFPMLYQEMVKRGAQIFLAPSAFTHTTGKMHWEPLIKARAIENQCYVIAAAQDGYHENGRQTYGHSIAVDYLGQVQALRLKGNGIITIELDLDVQQKLRKSFPVLNHAKQLN